MCVCGCLISSKAKGSQRMGVRGVPLGLGGCGGSAKARFLGRRKKTWKAWCARAIGAHSANQPANRLTYYPISWGEANKRMSGGSGRLRWVHKAPTLWDRGKRWRSAARECHMRERKKKNTDRVAHTSSMQKHVEIRTAFRWRGLQRAGRNSSCEVNFWGLV